MAGLTMSSLGYVEPMRKNWFIVQFNNIPNGNSESNDKESLSIACKECDVPKLTTKENEIHRINDIVYTPGKSSYDTISFTFNEYIQDSDDTSNNRSAGNILYDWQNNIHNALSGVQGAKRSISTTAAIVQIDGNGNIVRAWTLYNAWPTTVEYDSLGSDAGEILTVKATLRFDWAELTEYSIDISNKSIGTKA